MSEATINLAGAGVRARRRTLAFAALGVAGALALPAAAAAAPPPAPAAPIRSASEYDYPPFALVNAAGEADGFSVQLMRAALRAMDRSVTFETGPWPEIKQALADGRLEALPMVARTPERERTFDFTFPYLTMHGTIVVRKGTTGIAGPEDLKGKRVAVLQEDVAHEYLRRSDLGAVIVPLPSFAVALRELSAGQHDAVVVQKLLAFQIMKEFGLANLMTVGPPLAGYTQAFCFAVRKGNQALLGVLNEGLSVVMADGTFRRLHTEWFSSLEAMGRTRSRIVVGGDRDYPPYEFLDRNGQPAGFNVDLTRAIARRMGLDVDIRLGSWVKVRDGLERREIDVVQGMFYSAERDLEFDFSPPHSLVQHAVVVRRGSPRLSDLKDLAGKSILVMEGDILHELARQQGYEKQLVPVATQELALRLLAAGQHDCALVAKVPALYWIEKNGWENLSVSEAPVLSAEYCYAVPSGQASTLADFAEGLAALRRTGEYRAIQARWLGPYEGAALGFGTIARYVLYGALPLGALLLGSLLWSRSLKAQVLQRTEELRAANAQLTEASERTSEFLAMMSHELRNPLAALRNAIFLLDHLPRGGEKAGRAWEVLRRQTAHLARLVDDLLDLTRIARGKIELQRARIDARQVVARACEDHRGLFEGRGVRLEPPLPGAPVWVDADATRVSQMIGNLLHNAAKFTPESGSTVVSVAQVEGKAEIRVRDDGVGMDPELVPHVFDAFTQGSRAGAPSHGGLGLGLALVKSFAELHGGSASARSDGPRRGSEFTVWLPLAADPGLAAEEAARVAPAQGRSILLVEDNPDSRQTLAEVLALHGHRVEVAADGASGIAKARALRPDVVLCDIGLPDIDGYAVAQALRSDPNLRSAYLVALSGYAQPRDRRRASEAGFDAHLAKPADLEELARIVASAGREA
jgi:ABC-type amino acid transport substrate-binding protein/nitrogen-specific signal transduction histidine kinase/ActR/RegA family two-component response regulator